MPPCMNQNSLTPLGNIVDAPGFILPWLDRFYDPDEIKIVEGIGRHPMDAAGRRNALDLSQNFIDRSLKRGILSEQENGDLVPAGFHTRYDIWALFEGFKDIPQDIRDRLNQWELDHYIRAHEKEVDHIRTTGRLDPSKILPRYLLLDEALDVLDQVELVYLWPCNCRSMIHACKKPVYTCLRFDNSQGQGYEISREKAKEIVLEANKKGLMQSGELGRGSDGRPIGAICNCCPDCCFPHLLARKLKAEKIWPLSRYIVDWQETECSFCGVCAKRCPFQAFRYAPRRENKEAGLTFFKERCRGCGLCAVTCPGKAIDMKKINQCSSE